MRKDSSKIRHEERLAFRRKQLVWEEYIEIGRRFESAYRLMLWTWDDFEDMKDLVESGHEEEFRLELARKRHRSAQEEFQYQRNQLIYLLSAGV